MIKVLKNQLFIFGILIFLISITCYIYYIKEKIVITENQHVLVQKGVSEFQFLEDIKKNDIHINIYEWYLVKKFFHRDFSLKYGEYFFLKNTKLKDFQEKLKSGKIFLRKFTLIEGSDSKTLKEKLKNTNGLIGEIPFLKEGIYKPDTYSYKWGDTIESLLKRMKRHQNKTINKYWLLKKTNNFIKTKNQALILASIIEKESGNKGELNLISSVLMNRLEKNMKLQSDVTVAFGLNMPGSELKKENLKDKNIYNTYLHFGLPPTPISYPGEESIKAALSPKKTDFLYFVSDGKGGHRFSNSYKKHKKNIKIWLKSKKNKKNEKN